MSLIKSYYNQIVELKKQVRQLQEENERLREAAKLMLDIINKYAPDSAIIKLGEKILLEKK